jgi:hypothetical protein
MNTTDPPLRSGGRRKRRSALAPLIAIAALLAACADDDAAPSATTTPITTPRTTSTPEHETDQAIDPADRAAAVLATAGFQDVATAEAAGYANSLDTLGCFTDPELGGMGLHYIDQAGRPRVHRADRRVEADHPAAAVRDGFPPAPDAALVGPPRMALEEQPGQRVPGLEPSRAAMPTGHAHLRQGPAVMTSQVQHRPLPTRRSREPTPAAAAEAVA